MMKKFPIFFLLTLLSANADPLAIESFIIGDGNYEAATSVAGKDPLTDGFTGPWQFVDGQGEPNTIEAGLSFAGVFSEEGALQYLGDDAALPSGRAGRVFDTGTPYDDTADGVVLYFSALMETEMSANSYNAIELFSGGFGNRQFQIATGEAGLVDSGVLTDGSNYAVRLFDNNTAAFSGDLGADDGSVSLFIVKMEFSSVADLDVISVWRNPADLASEAANTPDFTATGFNFVFDRIALASFGASGATFDELRLGEEWADVTTVSDFDTDADGLPDIWERANGLTVGVNDADLDGDIDGLSNSEERLNRTDPQDDDTDDDLLKDGEEVNVHGTKPDVADTDEDGIDDGQEIANGTNPLLADNTEFLFIDGRREFSYGEPDVVQTIQTGFGNNLSEWNAAYSQIRSGVLYLFFAGNVESNFNKVELFIDSTDAIFTNVFTSAGNDGSDVMNGMTFDTGFEPDFYLILRRGDGKFDVDFADLGAGQYASYLDVFGGTEEGSGILATATTTTLDNPLPELPFGYNNSNVEGIGGNAGVAADQDAARRVRTGLEIGIPLATLGNPEKVKIMLFQNNSNHDFLANQSLAGLPEGAGNIGGGVVDFGTFDGDQFYELTVGEPAPLVLSDLSYDAGVLSFVASGLVLTQEYHLQFSPDLVTPFQAVSGSGFDADENSQSSIVVVTAPKGFYRLIEGVVP